MPQRGKLTLALRLLAATISYFEVGGMTEANDLCDTLRKIEALFAGAGTPGERDAAEAALGRVKARLADHVRRDPPIEMQFSLAEQWSRLLFNALCRRYGLRRYRYKRRKRTTVVVRLPRAYLREVTRRLIGDRMHGDTSDAEEIAGALSAG